MFAPTCFSRQAFPQPATSRLPLVINTGYRPLFFTAKTTWSSVYSVRFSTEKFQVRNKMQPFRTYTFRPLIKNPRKLLVANYTPHSTLVAQHKPTQHNMTRRSSVECESLLSNVLYIKTQRSIYLLSERKFSLVLFFKNKNYNNILLIN